MTVYAPDRTRLSEAELAFIDLPPEERPEAIARTLGAMSEVEADELMYAWWFWSRPQQRPPSWRWLVWIIRAGRGFGKTRTGAEYVREEVNEGRASRVTLIAPTAPDGRDIMVEGESGILAVHPDATRPTYEPSKRKLTWPNGAIGLVRSAEEPDRLRGLNSDLVWGDEPASWKTGSEAWDNAMLGNRSGKNPRAILTMTPRRVPWLRDLEAQETTAVTSGSTYENKNNVAPSFLRLIMGRFEGTRLGRQELHAEYLDDVEGALWMQAVIDATRIMQFDRADPNRSLREWIVAAAADGVVDLAALKRLNTDRRPWVTRIAVDPPAETAECGIVVGTAPKGAIAGADHCVILDDMSHAGTPEEWGATVVRAWREHGAEAVYVEANQGGDMVRAVIHAVDPSCPVRKIRATESKSKRAEPVAALYSKGWIHHLGILPKLEDQQTTWVPDESKSPDRLDAAVHCVRSLLRETNLVPTSVASPVGRRGASGRGGATTRRRIPGH